MEELLECNGTWAMLYQDKLQENEALREEVKRLLFELNLRESYRVGESILVKGVFGVESST